MVENDQGLASPPLRSISLPFTLFENRVVFLAWGIKRRPSFLLEFSCPPLFRARSFPIVGEAGLGARSGNCDSSLLTYPVIKPIFCTPVDCHRKDVRVCCCRVLFVCFYRLFPVTQMSCHVLRAQTADKAWMLDIEFLMVYSIEHPQTSIYGCGWVRGCMSENECSCLCLTKEKLSLNGLMRKRERGLFYWAGGCLTVPMIFLYVCIFSSDQALVSSSCG